MLNYNYIQIVNSRIENINQFAGVLPGDQLIINPGKQKPVRGEMYYLTLKKPSKDYIGFIDNIDEYKFDLLGDGFSNRAGKSDIGFHNIELMYRIESILKTLDKTVDTAGMNLSFPDQISLSCSNTNFKPGSTYFIILNNGKKMIRNLIKADDAGFVMMNKREDRTYSFFHAVKTIYRVTQFIKNL